MKEVSIMSVHLLILSLFFSTILSHTGHVLGHTGQVLSHTGHNHREAHQGMEVPNEPRLDPFGPPDGAGHREGRNPNSRSPADRHEVSVGHGREKFNRDMYPNSPPMYNNYPYQPPYDRKYRTTSECIKKILNVSKKF